jgi:hypothetical protein
LVQAETVGVIPPNLPIRITTVELPRDVKAHIAIALRNSFVVGYDSAAGVVRERVRGTWASRGNEVKLDKVNAPFVKLVRR